MKNRKLTFAQSVFSGKSQREAALAAGYKSGNGLNVTAARLMKDAVVLAELGRLRLKSDEQAVATRSEALKVLSAELRATVADFLTFREEPFGTGVIQVPALDLEKARGLGSLGLLRELAFDEHGNVKKIKLPDVDAAVDRLAKMLGWNTPELHTHELRFPEMSNREIEAFLTKTVTDSRAGGADPGGAVPKLVHAARPKAAKRDPPGDGGKGAARRGSAPQRL